MLKIDIEDEGPQWPDKRVRNQRIDVTLQEAKQIQQSTYFIYIITTIIINF